MKNYFTYYQYFTKKIKKITVNSQLSIVDSKKKLYLCKCYKK